MSKSEWEAETAWIRKLDLDNPTCPLLFAPLAIDSPFQDWNPQDIPMDERMSHQEDLLKCYIAFITKVALATRKSFLSNKLKIEIR
jgi:hypothetical protein